MENQLRIEWKNVNLEILAKLLNSVARKYDCQVRYNRYDDRITFTGDEAYWSHISEELLGLFLPERSMQTVAAISRDGTRDKRTGGCR